MSVEVRYNLVQATIKLCLLLNLLGLKNTNVDNDDYLEDKSESEFVTRFMKKKNLI